MGDRSGVQLPVRKTYLSINTNQVNSARPSRHGWAQWVPAKGGDALQLGSKGRYGACMAGR